jgi:hypothetical protein
MEQDVIGTELIDVSGLSLDDLLAEADDSSLARVLNKVLACDYGHAFGFQSSI